VTEWAEVVSGEEASRFSLLAKELSDCGVENTLHSVTCKSEELEAMVSQLLKDHPKLKQIRFTESLMKEVPLLSVQSSAGVHSLRSADTLAKEFDSWWPKNFLYEGFLAAIAIEFKKIDLSASVFLAGASAVTRTFVFALARVGFQSFYLMDPDESRAKALAEDLRRRCFGCKFNVVKKNAITQLPAVCSLGINTILFSEAPELLPQLHHLNFLSAGGIWLDSRLSNFSISPNSELRNAGAIVYSATDLASYIDSSWAESSLQVKINLSRYQKALAATFEISS
jgi:shikimate 5-dehydrogenase